MRLNMSAANVTINDEVIINTGLFKDKIGVVKRINGDEYDVDIHILGKKVSTVLFINEITKKDAILSVWNFKNTDMVRTNSSNHIVAHIMYMPSGEDYLAYVYKPKGNTDLPEYERFSNIEQAAWWCDENLTVLGYKL